MNIFKILVTLQNAFQQVSTQFITPIDNEYEPQQHRIVLYAKHDICFLFCIYLISRETWLFPIPWLIVFSVS